MLIRPEQISLCAPGASASVTGKVTETRYHGHDAIVVVDVAEAGLPRLSGPVNKQNSEGSV